MRVMKIAGKRCGFVSIDELMEGYRGEAVARGKAAQVMILAKSAGEESELKRVMSQKAIIPPVNMLRMLQLMDIDGYHSGACNAIADGAVMHVRCKNGNVADWIVKSQNQMNLTRLLRSCVLHLQACGNGFLLKLRDRQGKWVGLELLLPQEIEIRHNVDENGFLRPNYVQIRDSKQLPILNRDVIHIKKPTYKSSVWGLSSLPVAQGIETLKEIKALDYNNFRNGLLIDYFILVNGGSLSESESDEDGVYSRIEEMLMEAKGTRGGHSSILLESDDQGVKIDLVPLRQGTRDGDFQNLKSDIRDEMLAYHRVPKRIIAQATAGQLGGDNNSDMILFHNMVLKPIQDDIAEHLSEEFAEEYGWSVDNEDWDFGNLPGVFESEEERAFKL